MLFEISLGFRYLLEKRKNNRLSNSTLITIGIIAMSTMVLVTVISIVNGYIYGIMQRKIEVDSYHLRVFYFYPEKTISTIINSLSKYPEVKSLVPVRDSQGLLTANGKNKKVYWLRILPDNVLLKDNGFKQNLKIIAGNFDLGKGNIVIGDSMASELNVSVGDQVILTALDEKSTRTRFAKMKKLTISAIFSIGYNEYDIGMVLIGPGTGIEIYGKQELFRSIGIKISDPVLSEKFQKKLEKENRDLTVYTWQTMNHNMYAALQGQKNTIGFIVTLIVIVATFNIIGNLIMTVIEKEKEIGILKTLGASKYKIWTIFIFDGIFLALIGTIAGLLGGLLLTVNVNHVVNFIEYLVYAGSKILYHFFHEVLPLAEPQQIDILSKEFYLDKIYYKIDFFELFLIIILVLFFSSIASFLPASKAAKLKPMEVIRYE